MVDRLREDTQMVESLFKLAEHHRDTNHLKCAADILLSEFGRHLKLERPPIHHPLNLPSLAISAAS